MRRRSLRYARAVCELDRSICRRKNALKDREELEQLTARELAAEHHRALRVRAVHMKNVLGDIQTNCDNLRHGRLPQWCFNNSTLAHRCRRVASTSSALGDLRGFS